MLNKEKFIQLLTGLCEMYSKPMSEFILDIYYETLKNYTYEQVNSAMVNIVKTNKYNTLPKPAEFIEWIEGSKEDKAYLAWTLAHKAIKEHGYYNTVEFEDPVISHVIQELGGWLLFSDIKKEELPFWEKRFREFYKVIEKRGVKEPVKLMGFIEAKNRETGYNDKIPAPVKIGFEEYKELTVTKGENNAVK